MGLAATSVGDSEVERLSLGHVSAAARAAFAGLADGPALPSPEEGRSTDGDESDALSGDACMCSSPLLPCQAFLSHAINMPSATYHYAAQLKLAPPTPDISLKQFTSQ